MKCPECGKQLKVPEHAKNNMETYGSACIVRTQCCKKLIRMYPLRSFSAEVYQGANKQDDWGD